MRDFLLASREPGKLLHAFANFLPRHTQLIELLEVQPKLRADAKPVAKTQRCVRRDTALAIDDSGDPIDRHVNLPRQLRCRNVEFSQLFGKMLAGVNRGARHGMPHLVVINDLDIDRVRRSAGLHFDRGSGHRYCKPILEFGVATQLCYRIAMKRDEAISRLKQHEADLKRLGVEHLYMFGSTARGEAKDDSDVDLFFDYEKGKLGLFELMDVKEYAANILGRRGRYHDA